MDSALSPKSNCLVSCCPSINVRSFFLCVYVYVCFPTGLGVFGASEREGAEEEEEELGRRRLLEEGRALNEEGAGERECCLGFIEAPRDPESGKSQYLDRAWVVPWMGLGWTDRYPRCWGGKETCGTPGSRRVQLLQQTLSSVFCVLGRWLRSDFRLVRLAPEVTLSPQLRGEKSIHSRVQSAHVTSPVAHMLPDRCCGDDKRAPPSVVDSHLAVRLLFWATHQRRTPRRPCFQGTHLSYLGLGPPPLFSLPPHQAFRCEPLRLPSLPLHLFFFSTLHPNLFFSARSLSPPHSLRLVQHLPAPQL
jgi:hypothetical protein